MLILLAITPLLAQQEFNWYESKNGNGFSFNDSVWTQIYVPDTTFSYQADTTWAIDTSAARASLVIPLQYTYEWIMIAVQDTGATYDDTLVVESGLIRFTGETNDPTYSDTTWHNIPVKDSTWAEVNILVDDNSVHAYLIWYPLFDMIRIRKTNVEAVENWVTYVWGTAKRSGVD